MKSLKSIFAAFVATAAIAVVPAANAAPVVHFAASGSSAMFQQFAVTVVDSVAINTAGFTGGGAIHHFTTKSKCADSILAGTPCVGINDTRMGGIPPETATFWAVWVCDNTAPACNGTNATDVWYYDQVDSTVGVRTYLGGAQTVAAPGTTCAAAPCGAPNGADKPLDVIKSLLFTHGDANGFGNANCTTANCDAVTLPTDVYNAINNAVLNTGMTDIRPEDALFATERANATSTLSPWSGLGYANSPTALQGASIQSSFSTTFATPVAFGLPGTNDPITSIPVPNTITVYPVGEEPILFIANRTNDLGDLHAGQAWYNNVVDNVTSSPQAYVPSPIGQLFGGVNCSGSSNAIGNFAGGVFTSGLPPGIVTDFAVNPILREPLSGTMNTVEFSSFRTFGGKLGNVGGSEVSNSNVVVTTSQESFVVAVAGGAPINPLGGAGPNPPGTICVTNGGSGLGSRFRAVGTGEEIGGSKAPFTGIELEKNALGYAFFSFGNVSPIAKNPNFGYLLLDGVDPIFNSYAGGDPGQPATGGAEQGELPSCNPALNGGAGGCLKGDVWTGGAYFPHLVDGTYRAWSLLRALCDTATAHCKLASDPFGTEGVINSAQKDIHGTGLNPQTAVADFLPFSDDGLFGPAGGYGDAEFIRSHYAFQATVGAGTSTYASTHITPSFSIFPNGLNADQANGTGGSPEAGGDAGGCIVAAIQPSLASVKDTFLTNGGTKMKFDYNALGANALVGVCGSGANTGGSCTASFTGSGIAGSGTCGAGNTCNPPSTGLSVAATGFPAGPDNKDNGVFQVTRILTDGQIKVRVNPANSTIGINPAPAGVTFSANTGCSQ